MRLTGFPRFRLLLFHDAPLRPLLLLEAHLLLVRLVPQALLHFALIGPPAAIGRRDVVFHLVQLDGHPREVVHAVGARRRRRATPELARLARLEHRFAGGELGGQHVRALQVLVPRAVQDELRLAFRVIDHTSHLERTNKKN